MQVLTWAPRQVCGLWWLSCGLNLLWSAPAVAAEPALSTEAAHVRVPRLEGAVVVDGVLNEPQWQQAAVITDYRIFEPVEEGALPGDTEARIYYDGQSLHIGVVCRTPRPQDVRAHIAPREDINQDDQIGIYLDTFDDDRQAFVFYLNALGIQQDARFTETGWNQSWDTVLRSEGRLTSEGYVVEVSIPFRSLRYPATVEQTWGLILTRKFAAQGIKGSWPVITRQRPNMIAQAARLEGLRELPAASRLELRPEAIAGLVLPEPSDSRGAAGPLTYHFEKLPAIASAGLSARYGLTSNVTLDATFNPDFSQAEDDPSQLDLNNRYALFFAERRSFFLEGAEYLQAPLWSFYSRSVVAPLLGLKITGKEQGYGVGLLSAWDRSPLPTLTRAEEVGETPGFRPSELEGAEGQPFPAWVTVGRVSRDIGEESNASFTLSDKEIINTETGSPAGYNRLAGASMLWAFNPQLKLQLNTAYAATGRAGAEFIAGGAANIYLVYQNRLDRLALSYHHVEPTFRNENAYLTRPGYQTAELYLHRRFEPKLPGLVYVRPSFYTDISRDLSDPSLQPWNLYSGVETRFDGQRYLYLYLPIWREFWGGEQFELAQLNVSASSERRNQFQWSFSFYEGTGIDYRAVEKIWQFQPRLDVKWRPSPNLMLTGNYARVALLDAPQPSVMFLLERLMGGTSELLRADQQLVRLNLSVNLSQRLSIRAIGDYNYSLVRSSDGSAQMPDQSVSGQLLVQWMLHPGTAAYVGFSPSCGWDGTGDKTCFDSGATQLFLKFSYLWRV